MKCFNVWMLLFLGWFVLSCTKVPVTGRRQMNLLPEGEMIAMSKVAYADFLGKNHSKIVPQSDQEAMMVNRVGKKIAKRVEAYLKDHKQEKRIKDFEWEFYLIDDPTVNAWCMPGGKVVVYTGILDVCKEEAGLAVVIGHEVAHAIARHGNERMSQSLALEVGVGSLSAAMGKNPTLTQKLFLQSIGVGSQLGMLKYSRKHESEADHMGIIFMAMAGYDPENAVKFWKRMSEAGGAKPPEIVSTHPSDERRIRDLEEHMGEARFYYRAWKGENNGGS